jgi:magnesium transporter
MEDVINTGQRPKLEPYDDLFFLTLNSPLLKENGVKIQQISLFFGEGYLISFYPGAADPFESVRKRLRNPKNRIRKRKADYLLYALIDTVVDQGFPVLEWFAEQIEDLETDLLDRPETETLSAIHQARQDSLLLRRLLWPHRDVINQLFREEH